MLGYHEAAELRREVNERLAPHGLQIVMRGAWPDTRCYLTDASGCRVLDQFTTLVEVARAVGLRRPPLPAEHRTTRRLESALASAR